MDNYLEYNLGYEDSVYRLSRWLDIVKAEEDTTDSGILMSMLDISAPLMDWIKSSFIYDILEDNKAEKEESNYVRTAIFFNPGGEHTHETFQETGKEVVIKDKEEETFSHHKFNYYTELDGLVFELVGEGYIVRFMSAYANEGNKGETEIYIIKPSDSLYNLNILTYRLPTEYVIGKEVSFKKASNHIGLELVLNSIEED